jgi:amidohydrolase
VVVGAITTASEAMRARAEQEIRRQLADLHLEGVGFEVAYQRKVIAGVTNDVALEAELRPALAAAVGEANLLPMRGVIPLFSEDFGAFQERVPGVMYWLGVSNPEKGTVGMPHSPDHVADEEAIFVGARALAAALLYYLGAHPAAAP